MAQRPLEPGTPGNLSTAREWKYPDGTWKRAKPLGNPDSRWRARQKVRSLDGDEVYRQAYGKTKLEAERVVKQKVADFLAPRTSTVSADMKVSALAEMWLQQKRNARDGGDLAYNTLGTYQQAWAKHLAETFGNKRVDRVGKTDVRNALLTIHGTVGPAAAKSCRSVLVGIFGVAFDADVIARNPASKISLPTGRRRVVHSLSVEEAGLLRAYLWDARLGVKPDIRVLVEIQLGTGARVGEVCALEWGNVDFKRGRLWIETTMIRHEKQGLFRDPVKTPTSERNLGVPARVLRLLQEHRAEHGVDQMVLHGPTGIWLDTASVGAALRSLMAVIASDTKEDWWLDVTSHTLRRTAATLLLSAGVPIHEVADHLGHSDISTTLRHYVGRNKAGSSRAAQILDWEEATDDVEGDDSED